MKINLIFDTLTITYDHSIKHSEAQLSNLQQTLYNRLRTAVL